MSVDFDKTAAKVGETMTATVEVKRIAEQGYGMMLAEIGLPPGAEVQRESLEKMMNNAGWSIGRYDLLPDRLIVYVWPTAGGSRFNFSFKPRFGEQALTAPSTLYDYYNPDARVVVTPKSFVITE
jgi:hypothetical protein